MRPHFLTIIPFVILANLAAQTAPPSEPKDAAPASRETALDNLLAERESPKAFDAAVERARKAGVSEQAILEARFLYHIDRREDAQIAAMLPEFLKRRDSFKQSDSAIFGMKEDWLAVIEYVQAIVALEKQDKAAFKQHITEAFWLSPRQASAFAPHVERLRLEECMRSLKIDFTTKFTPLLPGDAVALDALMAGKKALLLHFWSPMSRECEGAMPDFAATASDLTSKGVAVVSLIPDDSPKLLADARAMIQPLGEKPPGAWVIDSKEKPFGVALRVQDLPTMVLVSPDGAVLFNGDPSDDEFWEKLSKIDANITRPKSPLEHGE